jgi:hypothetical protein
MRIKFSDDIPEEFLCERVSPETGYVKCHKPAERVEVTARGGQVYLRPYCKTCFKVCTLHEAYNFMHPNEVPIWILMNS